MSRSARARPRAVLFDLDGTLLDTAPDLAAALNRTRADENLPPLPAAVIRPWVSRGSPGLLRLGFGDDQRERDTAARGSRLLAHYRAEIATRTHLFAGMAEVLDALDADGRPWGIVTNKPGWLTTPLVAALALADRAACVVAGDTLAQAKPHPAPLLYAAAAVAVRSADCLYIGDAESDVTAARAAGMAVLVALYGYLMPADDPRAWGADGVISTPSELHAWI